MCVRVLLKEHVGTLPRAIVGLVLLGSDNPVPTELLEVHRQRISTAALLLRRFVAVQADSALRPVFPAVRCIQFNKWNLQRTEIIALAGKETVPSDLRDLSRYTLAYLLTPYQLHNTENLNDTMIIRQLRTYIADRTRTGVILVLSTSNTDVWHSKRLSEQNFSSESDSRSRDPRFIAAFTRARHWALTGQHTSHTLLHYEPRVCGCRNSFACRRAPSLRLQVSYLQRIPHVSPARTAGKFLKKGIQTTFRGWQYRVLPAHRRTRSGCVHSLLHFSSPSPTGTKRHYTSHFSVQRDGIFLDFLYQHFPFIDNVKHLTAPPLPELHGVK